SVTALVTLNRTKLAVPASSTRPCRRIVVGDRNPPNRVAVHGARAGDGSSIAGWQATPDTPDARRHANGSGANPPGVRGVGVAVQPSAGPATTSPTGRSVGPSHPHSTYRALAGPAGETSSDTDTGEFRTTWTTRWGPVPALPFTRRTSTGPPSATLTPPAKH